MNRIIETINGVFPNSRILLLYYSGSKGYGLEENDSDIDVTVILQNYKGCMHINLGIFDAFIFSEDTYLKRQSFDLSIPLYYLAAADDVINIDKNIIFFEEEYKKQVQNIVIDSTFICNHLAAVVEYYKIRLAMSETFKSNYHIFRVRAMLDHYEKTGRYELINDGLWMDNARDYKKNYNNEIGKEYIPLLHEQLRYLENYRNRMMDSGLE